MTDLRPAEVPALPSVPPGFLGLCLRFTLDETETGGAERDRTADLLLAKQMLSQLSYSPENSAC
jgi:hypothetical protein